MSSVCTCVCATCAHVYAHRLLPCPLQSVPSAGGVRTGAAGERAAGGGGGEGGGKGRSKSSHGDEAKGGGGRGGQGAGSSSSRKGRGGGGGGGGQKEGGRERSSEHGPRDRFPSGGEGVRMDKSRRDRDGSEMRR
jgi:hypothetical protein